MKHTYYLFVLLIVSLLSPRSYASDAFEDVKRSYEQSMKRQDRLFSAEDSADMLASIAEFDNAIALTDQQLAQLLLLKEELGVSLQEYEDFRDSIKRNGFYSYITKETLNGYFDVGHYKYLEGHCSKEQQAFFYIYHDKAPDKNFTLICYRVIDKIIKSHNKLSKASIDAFHKEVVVALNKNAHTIVEAAETFFDAHFPGLFIYQGGNAFIDLDIHKVQTDAIAKDEQANYLFKLWRDYLAKLTGHTLELFEENVMSSIRNNSHMITHVPLLSAYNSTRIYLNIYKTISNIFNKECENIFRNIPINTESIFLEMLSKGTQDGQFNQIVTKLKVKQGSLTQKERDFLASFKGKRLDAHFVTKLGNYDENQIQHYVSKIFPVRVRRLKVEENTQTLKSRNQIPPQNKKKAGRAIGFSSS